MAHAIKAKSKTSIDRPRVPGEKDGTGGSRRKRGAPAEAAVVVTLTVIFVAELPAVTAFGTVQVASEGAPVQVKLTLWLNPPSPAIVKVYVAACPGATAFEVTEPEAAASVKSWPVPLRATLCGLPIALSEMLMVPVLVPLATGLKVTEIVQLAPTLTLVPQVLVWEKSPLVVIVRGVRAPVPVLDSVSVCGELRVETACPEKVRLVAERLTTGTSPVPLKFMVWGLLRA
jgi:hypothetical protein